MHPESDLHDEIRRFERQYVENPGSLVFARLADLHRKARNPERALAVLRRGLERHPDYLSAYIVQGRALLELDRDADARESFARVLELDAQNLVALRSLAEIARRRGDPEDAARWLERLLQVDPRNEEARQALTRIRVEERDSTGSGRGRSPASENGSTRSDAETAGGIAGLEELLRGGPDSPPDASGEEEAGEVATETLAGLYASQGLLEEAVEMYERLVRERPEDRRLRERLAEARRELDGESPAEDAAAPERDPPPSEPDVPARPETAAPGHEATARGEAEPETSREPDRGERREPPSDAHRPSEDGGTGGEAAASLGRREALGAAEPPRLTMRQHLRELLRGEAVPGLVNELIAEPGRETRRP